jgi:hypothetical protein
MSPVLNNGINETANKQFSITNIPTCRKYGFEVKTGTTKKKIDRSQKTMYLPNIFFMLTPCLVSPRV